MLTAKQCKYFSIYDKKEIKRLNKLFEKYNELKDAIQQDPYYIYCDICGWTFTKADKLIIQRYPNFKNSKDRCNRAMQYAIKSYAYTYGSTKMMAASMYNNLVKVAPECVDYTMDCVNDEQFYYDESDKSITLSYLYQDEKNIARAIKRRLGKCKPYDWDIEKYRKLDGVEFTDEQMTILRLARDNKIAILSGSAGTGKSAATKALVTMLENNGQTYQMLAPTGIAAKRLREATGRKASTIHMYLLDADVELDYLIIDEFSMVGVELLSMLLSLPTITNETRFIFICDEAQLASISPGNIIENLLDYGKIPMARLTKVFRYGIGGIATIATDIRNGKMIDMSQEWPDARCDEYDDKVQHNIIYWLNRALENYNINDILLLTPKKIGNLGTYRLNAIIQDWTNGNGAHLEQFDYIIKDRGQEYPVEFHIGDKVINVKNNYSALTSAGEYGIIMNGEIGIVTRIIDMDGDDYLCVQFDNDEIAYSKKEIRNLQLAYALTCHKVQGQQAKCVIFLAHEDSAFMLTRNLMYVAVSRAQEMLYIISNEDVIESGLTKQETNSRMTYLNKLLED